MSTTEEPQRTSGGSGSGRSSGSSRGRQNPQQQLSTIEKSVTHLLVATKQLLETLTLWSRGSATEGEVSDVYVRLGYEFNIACRAFNAIGVETNDLGPVPDLLRSILEDTLSQEASQASLDKYLPRIRDIIINLLHGLKKKQQRLRQKNGSTREGEGARPPRQASTASNMSTASTLTEQLEDIPSRHMSSRSFAQRAGSGDLGGPDLPPRTTSAPTRGSPRRSAFSPKNSMHQTGSRDTLNSDSGSSISSNAMQNMPVIAPYPEDETMPTNQSFDQDQPSPEPPKPPPKQNDALTALQRGGELERRASRRFSQYQIQKQLGPSMNGIPTIPPAQNSPIPNRGRDVKEGMSAVRSRGSIMHSRAKSRNERAAYDASPNRTHDVRRISERSEEGVSLVDQPPVLAPTVGQTDEPMDSPIIKTPEDKLGRPAAFPFPQDDDQAKLSATLNGPIGDSFSPDTAYNGASEPTKDDIPKRNGSRQARFFADSPPQSQQFVPETSPQPGKELPLFLQYKTKIKKFVLPDGGDLSIGKLQLAFIEKFNWNTHNNGVDLPDIYIQDPVSGVRYELEDLTDIKENSVLVLNVEALDEVKRHFDDGLGGIRRIVESIKTGLEDQTSALQIVTTQQQETAKELANLSAAAPATVSSIDRPAATPARNASVKDAPGQLEEVQKMRRDLAVVRQTYSSFVTDMNTSMAAIRTKATQIKTAAADSALPALDSHSGRAYLKTRVAEISTEGERMLDRADDVQDTVEDLRKDVVIRGVRPHARQLDSVSKEIAQVSSNLKKHREVLKREKPIWTKQWERDLQDVCDEKESLTVQEDICADLEQDLENLVSTFTLVEQACKQQNLQQNPAGAAAAAPGGGGGSGSRNGSLRSLPLGRGDIDPSTAKNGVLGEVRALQPNHESRLEAIERAERLRQRELEARKGGEFQRELGSFVEEGKLKKSGGVEEVERVRLAREEKTRREVHELKLQREREKAEKAEREAAEGGAGGEGADGAPAAEGEEGLLEVPGAKEDVERESSPEPVFVEAKEEVATPADEGGSL